MFYENMTQVFAFNKNKWICFVFLENFIKFDKNKSKQETLNSANHLFIWTQNTLIISSIYS